MRSQQKSPLLESLKFTLSLPATSTPASEAPADLAASYDPMIRGTCLGLVSAVAYTGANIALRDLSRTEGLEWALFVSSFKAIPCFLLAWILVGYRLSRGLRAFPAKENRLPIFAAALMMQFGGNATFVWALSKIGLVLTVPMTFSTLICGSAICGRIFLGEPISRRQVISILVLLTSIVCLSVGANASLPDASPSTILTGILLAGISGFSYGANSIVIRRFVSGTNSVSSVVVVMSTTGVCILGSVAVASLGFDRIAQITSDEWSSLIWAGSVNAVAFFSVSTALKYIPAVRANLLNASQTAMCAVAGIVLFGEQLTPLLGTGIVLTIVGLLLLGLRRARKVPPVVPLGATPPPASVGK